ncbi:VRR-NUC domain-containing protein [Secundilactobacillus kimchicus]|uniref:VRR-NUC domain-containing protein n=1 Tax=Secundilactobacillus kimchicus TaxID=528209 RepID=UPI0031F6738E
MLFPKGFPDLCGFRHSDGRFFCLEIKNEKGRLRDDQKLFAKFVGQFPVLYGLARSVEDALKIVGEDEKD